MYRCVVMPKEHDKATRPPYKKIADSKNLDKDWDFIAERAVHYRHERPIVSYIYERKRCFDHFRKWIDLSQTEKVLKHDLFDEAGWTQFSFYFMERRIHTYFVEISRVIIKKAKRRIESAGLNDYAHIVIGDFRKLPFRSNTFDVTCSMDSITYVPEWEDCVNEQARVTRPYGHVIIMVPNLHNLFLGHMFLSVFDKIGVLRTETYYSIPLTRKELENAGKKAALDVEDISGFSIMIPQLGWFDRLSERYRDSSNSFIMWLLHTKDSILTMIEEMFYRIEKKKTVLNLLSRSIIMTGQKREIKSRHH